MDNNLQDHVKLEVAIECITSKIADFTLTNKDKKGTDEYEKAFSALVKENTLICQGDAKAITRILDEFKRRTA